MTTIHSTLETLRVILTNPACHHDLILAAIYLLAVLAAAFRNHRLIWAVYLTACATHILFAIEQAQPL